MTITRMLGLRQRLRGLANPVPLAPRARISPPSPRRTAPRPLDCGWCFEENGEEVHPHPECPIGRPATPPLTEATGTRCVHGDHFACHAAHSMVSIDDLVAAQEEYGRLARTTERLERLAAELDARHVRYAWTEQLAQELRAIAHDTVGG